MNELQLAVKDPDTVRSSQTITFCGGTLIPCSACLISRPSTHVPPRPSSVAAASFMPIDGWFLRAGPERASASSTQCASRLCLRQRDLHPWAQSQASHQSPVTASRTAAGAHRERAGRATAWLAWRATCLCKPMSQNAPGQAQDSRYKLSEKGQYSIPGGGGRVLHILTCCTARVLLLLVAAGLYFAAGIACSPRSPG